MNVIQAKEFIQDFIWTVRVSHNDWLASKVPLEHLPALLATNPYELDKSDLYFCDFFGQQMDGFYGTLIKTIEALMETELTDDEVIALAEMIQSNEKLMGAHCRAEFLRHRDFHDDMSDEQIAEIILFIFNKGSRRYDDYASFVAQLQSKPREMIKLLGLPDTDLPVFWKEVIRPTLNNGHGKYGNVTIVILELLRRQQLIKDMKGPTVEIQSV